MRFGRHSVTSRRRILAQVASDIVRGPEVGYKFSRSLWDLGSDWVLTAAVMIAPPRANRYRLEPRRAALHDRGHVLSLESVGAYVAATVAFTARRHVARDVGVSVDRALSLFCVESGASQHSLSPVAACLVHRRCRCRRFVIGSHAH